MSFHSTLTICCFLPSTVSKLLISISVCITDATHPANLNPLRYRGYYYDSETGFYYVSSRYYDPEIGRWINADDAIAGVGGDIRGYNLFAYCMNDPVNMSDHTGHWPQWIKNAASAVVNAVKKAVTVVANTVKSAVSSASNILKASSNSLPKKGEPGSSQTLPNPDGTPKQKRWYGPDGNPERDRDYDHSSNMPFPHDHEWKNGERGERTSSAGSFLQNELGTGNWRWFGCHRYCWHNSCCCR